VKKLTYGPLATYRLNSSLTENVPSK